MLKSENLKFNLYEETDFVRPEAFNENTQILDLILKQSASAVYGSYLPYDTINHAEEGLVLEFEKMPVFVWLMSEYGIVVSFRGCSQAFDVTHKTHTEYEVEVIWEDNRVRFKGIGCESLYKQDANGKYFALVI